MGKKPPEENKRPSGGGHHPEGRQAAGLRLWVFRATALVGIPVLLLVSLEIGLRVFGFGHSRDLVVECEVQGRQSYCDNHRFSELFFPPGVARPTVPFSLPVQKPEDSYRIFVLGGSAAQGDPDPAFGFGRILEEMLLDKYPGVDFEVVNASITAVNSHVVYRIARDLGRLEPDLFAVYLGNNEVVGPYGAGTVFSPLSPSLSFIRASVYLKALRTGQLIEKLVNIAKEDGEAPRRWRGMEMFLGKQVRADDPGMEKVYDHFRNNLEDIVEAGRNAGARVVVSTVASNLRDMAPFASLHRRDITEAESERWEEVYRSGIELESGGRYEEALRRYQEAGEIDGEYADLSYRLGRSYWATGKFAKAKEAYVRARDLDTLRFRADTRINRIIRSVTRGAGAGLVDAVAAFEEESPRGVPGDELLLEHVHMNFGGNYVLAKGFLRGIEEALPQWVRDRESGRPVLSRGECVRRLAFTWHDRYRIFSEMLRRTSRPPFTNQLSHEARVNELKREMEDIRRNFSHQGIARAEAAYRVAIDRDNSDPWLHYNYALLLQEKGDHEGAAAEFRSALRYIPRFALARARLASSLVKQGKLREAVHQCEEALRIKQDLPMALSNQAFALARLGELDRSIEQYEKLLKADPLSSVAVYSEMGRIRFKQGKLQEAAGAFRKAIEFNENTEPGKHIPDIHYNLSYVLKRMGRAQEASRHLSKALEGYRRELSERPGSSETHSVMGSALAESGDMEGASEHFRQAAMLNPANPANHHNLIRTLEAQGKVDQAIAAAQDAIEEMSKLGRKSAADEFRRQLEALKSKR